MAKANDKKQSKNLPAKPEPKGEAAHSGAMILTGDKMPVPDYIQKGNRGSENVTAEDIVIPRLEVLQALSPMCTKGNAEYNDDAEPGMLVNSVTKEIYGKEVFVVPVQFTKQWLVWKDRQKGGGFFGAYATPELAQDRVQAEGGKAAGVESIDTPTHLCLLVNVNSGSVDEVILSMPRTKAKVSRNWNSMIRLAGGDRFGRVYRITSQLEKNQKGEFYNYVIAQSGFPAKPLYDRAEKLYTQLVAGTRKMAMDTSGYNPDDEPGGGDTEM